mmetsp:Transcript_37969/g.127055  ORF Transcript_37969/g.127055 Transcript_37969/m.127055 type:complete len:206 (+) Transcript_37969:361-978(+)
MNQEKWRDMARYGRFASPLEASCGEWWKGEGGVTEPSTTYQGRYGEIGEPSTAYRVNVPQQLCSRQRMQRNAVEHGGTRVLDRAQVGIQDYVSQLLGSTTVPAGASVAPRACGPAGDTSCLLLWASRSIGVSRETLTTVRSILSRSPVSYGLACRDPSWYMYCGSPFPLSTFTSPGLTHSRKYGSPRCIALPNAASRTPAASAAR